MPVDPINLTSPVGRFVGGNLYKPNDKNFDGTPLTVKTGPNAGQARVNYFIALAIPKIPGHTHWSQTDWGQQIWRLGHAAHPQAAQRADFAWKIEDGDSTALNKRNRRPCDQEGYPGNWILKFSGGFAPKVYLQEGSNWVQTLQPDAVRPGHLIQVAFSVADNKQQQNAGIYLNTQAVAFRGYHSDGEITFGPTVEEMGFGAAPLPPGASTMPAPANMPAAAAPPPPGSAYPPPPNPGAYAAPYAAPAAPPAPPAPGAAPVYPNPAFVQMPPPAAPPAPAAPSAGAYQPPPPPSPAGGAAAYYPPPIAGPGGPGAPAAAIPLSNTRQMTALAGPNSYQAYITAGWDDAKLIAAGLMTA